MTLSNIPLCCTSHDISVLAYIIHTHTLHMLAPCTHLCTHRWYNYYKGRQCIYDSIDCECRCSSQAWEKMETAPVPQQQEQLHWCSWQLFLYHPAISFSPRWQELVYNSKKKEVVSLKLEHCWSHVHNGVGIDIWSWKTSRVFRSKKPEARGDLWELPWWDTQSLRAWFWTAQIDSVNSGNWNEFLSLSCHTYPHGNIGLDPKHPTIANSKQEYKSAFLPSVRISELTIYT